MMRLRRDLQFFFVTKRIDRFYAVLPEDWGAGYDNVTIACTVENQAMADYRLPLFWRRRSVTARLSVSRFWSVSTSNGGSAHGLRR